jgi:CysZ protein
MGQLVLGLGDLGRGWRFLTRNPALWGWVVAPALVTLVLVALTIWGAVTLADPAIAWTVGWLPGWLARWADELVRLLVIGALAIGGFVAFVSLAGVVAGPFCEALSEAVEERVTGQPAPKLTIGTLARGIALAVGHGLRRLAVALSTLALLFALGAFVPVVGAALAFIVGGYLAARAAAYDCYDAVLGRRLWSYDAKHAFLRRHRRRSLGLGAAVAGLMLVPFVNLVALGIGTVGATLAVFAIER